MSRCFPFPPPGYEVKLRLEDVTLLAKGKDKVKKEKKHKKDEEKKEGREKDKERHTEKDKDKHKHKDRDKKNGKKRSRHEKGFEGDRSNTEKVGSTSPQSSCVQELEQRIDPVGDATGSRTVDKAYDRNQGKSECLDGVASRSNGAYWSEGKSGLDPMAKKQSSNSQSTIPKIAIVFGDGADQRTVQMGRATENNFNELAEGKERKKHHSSRKEGEKSKDKNAKRDKGQAKIFTPQTFGHSVAQIGPPKEAAFVQELERRTRDENGATGSQVGTETDVFTQKIVQNPVMSANGNSISFPLMKENFRFGNGSFSTENGPKDDNQFKVPKVAIVHSLKVEERGSEVKSTKAAVEGVKRNEYSGKAVVDNRKTIRSKDEDQNKSRQEEKVKEEADNIVELSRFGHNSIGSTGNSNQMTFKLGYKNAGIIFTHNAIHDAETRPNKWQKTVPSSQPAAENGRHLKSSATITLSAPKRGPANGFKLDADEHKTTTTVCSQSPNVIINSPSASLEPMGTSPLGKMKTPIFKEANGKVSVQGSPPGVTGSQEYSLTAGKDNSIHEPVECQISDKLPLTAGKVNVAIDAHGSPSLSLKHSSTSRKKKRRDKSSSKTRPPHPDTKYLSQILSLPKMGELSTFDDSEWLFERERVSSKKGDMGCDRDEVEQVWAKSIHIDSADVYALPYVIPY